MIPFSDDEEPVNEDLAFIDELDDTLYDTEAARIDERNGNFTQDRVEDYLCRNIVLMSMINGQFEQARYQCACYGLHYNEMWAEYNTLKR